MELLLRILMIPGRLRFRWRNRRRLSESKALQDTLKQRCDEASRANVQTYLGVYNVGLFVALLEQDISAYSEAIYFGRSEWHRQFFARGLAVLLHEAAEDLPELLGKEYRVWLCDLDLDASWLDRLGAIRAKINVFRKSHTSVLTEIRNYVGAHRDHDASAQIELLGRLKAIDVYRLGAEFSQPLRDLISFYTELLAHMHDSRVMIRQIAKTIK